MSVTQLRWSGLAGVLLLAGCSGGDDQWTRDLPKTVTGAGVVLLDGEPVEGAVVVLAPVAPGKHPAQALTRSGGEFSLNAFPSKEGAVPGSYQVAVTKNVESGGGKRKDPSFYGEDAEHAAALPEATEFKNVLPEKYAVPGMSGLVVNIPPEGTSDLRIELKSAP